MNDDELVIPFLKKEEIAKRARQFLAEHAPDGDIPVDIERIVEYGLKILPVPIAGLKQAFNIDGWLSGDLREITVDLNQYDNHINRCRFTIAHEVGHYILHRGIYEQLDFSSVESWISTISNFDPDKFRWLESQANIFASFLLMPGEQLHETFGDAVELIRQQGFTGPVGSDPTSDYICRWMADKFKVSEQAMGFRLQNEGLIDPRMLD